MVLPLLIGRIVWKIRGKRDDENQVYLVTDKNGQQTYIDAKGRPVPVPQQVQPAGANQGAPGFPVNGTAPTTQTSQFPREKSEQQPEQSQPQEAPPPYATAEVVPGPLQPADHLQQPPNISPGDLKNLF